MRSKRNIRLAVSIFMAIAMALILPGLSIAGTLEPPTNAVDASGNPVPTMTMPPSWGQKLPAAERFALVLDGNGVLDKETGLVWEKSPSTTLYTWVSAILYCNDLDVGGRKGWHLPTIEQLASLVDTSASGSPKLPTGHPFTDVQSGAYWSATTYAGDTTRAWAVYFGDGSVGGGGKAAGNYAWCVRGGQSYDAY